MDIVRKIIGPKSKYDKSLPYTYMAKRQIMDDTGLCEYYYGHTICSLVAHLHALDIPPEEIEMFGIFRKKEVPLKMSLVTDKKGNWLSRPAICHALETHYQKTKDEIYRGHHEHETCCFDDRKLKGYGPY